MVVLDWPDGFVLEDRQEYDNTIFRNYRVFVAIFLTALEYKM